MFEELKKVKAIAFDFGGTLDIPGVHWFDYLWSILSKGIETGGAIITEMEYYDAYVFAERRMEVETIPENLSFRDTLALKFTFQFEYLTKNEILDLTEDGIKSLSSLFADSVYTDIQDNLELSKRVVRELSGRYKVYIVSNYYGNLKKILGDADILPYVTEVFDSTIVGIRKPDPAIWRMALEESGCKPEEFLIVGDSMKNDILPGESLGCHTIHLNQNRPEEGYMGTWTDGLEMVPQML